MGRYEQDKKNHSLKSEWHLQVWCTKAHCNSAFALSTGNPYPKSNSFSPNSLSCDKKTSTGGAFIQRITSQSS